MPSQNPVESNTDTSLTISRTFDAPPERVFDAWLDSEQISKWLGPRTMVESAKTLMLEPRVGGRYRLDMNLIGGEKLTIGGTYREIARPSRLVFDWTWEFEGQETVVTVTFRPAGKGTEMTLLHENFANAERRDSHSHGWTVSFEQLGAMLKG